MPKVRTGTASRWNDEKGFGFIKPDDGGEDVFVHRSALGESLDLRLETGDKVEFEGKHDDRKGKTNVQSVVVRGGGAGSGGGGGRGGRGGRDDSRQRKPRYESPPRRGRVRQPPSLESVQTRYRSDSRKLSARRRPVKAVIFPEGDLQEGDPIQVFSRSADMWADGYIVQFMEYETVWVEYGVDADWYGKDLHLSSEYLAFPAALSYPDEEHDPGCLFSTELGNADTPQTSAASSSTSSSSSSSSSSSCSSSSTCVSSGSCTSYCMSS